MKVEAESVFGCSSWISSLASRNREKFCASSNFMRTSGILQMCFVFFSHFSRLSFRRLSLRDRRKPMSRHSNMFIAAAFHLVFRGFCFGTELSPPLLLPGPRMCSERSLVRREKRRSRSSTKENFRSHSVLSEASKGSDGNPRRLAAENSEHQ